MLSDAGIWPARFGREEALPRSRELWWRAKLELQKRRVMLALGSVRAKLHASVVGLRAGAAGVLGFHVMALSCRQTHFKHLKNFKSNHVLSQPTSNVSFFTRILINPSPFKLCNKHASTNYQSFRTRLSGLSS